MANYDLDYEGSEVQDILDTGKSLEDDGYIFLGTATPSTIPGTPTERVAYVGGPGTYNNFGTTVVVPSGSIVVITYSGSAWSKTVINASLPVSTTLGSDNTTIPTSKAVKDVTDAINTKLGEGYVYAGIATATTNPGTPTGKVFYLAKDAGTYTNFGGLTLTEGVNILKYNGTAWSQEQLISIADIYKNPLIGYYECDTAGGTAAKTVAATGYVLPTTGGSVKIKMANSNTVSNATLNINSTGAKPLFYNGVRAGVGNTWDTNEIVEVFYDGTNYQAYNVAGSNGDGVFDISAYNLTDGQPTPYVDLAAALGTDGANVPQSLRKGGMSVKFIQGSVQSSDNKYVQWRLMAQSFTTDTTKWQGVDEKPITGSDNLVKSGGVAKYTDFVKSSILSQIDIERGGLDTTTGDELNTASALSRRARTTFVKSPFNITINSGFRIGAYLRYSIDSNGVVTFVNNNACRTTAPFVTTLNIPYDDYFYRILITKEDSTQAITDGELTSILSSFKGELNIDLPRVSRSIFLGKQVSIVGDSISTYDGYSIPSHSFYPNNNVPDVNSVEKTWWYSMLRRTGATLKENLSYSGGFIVTGFESYASILPYMETAQNTDVMILSAGQNDSQYNAPIGDIDFLKETLDTTKFFDAYLSYVRTARQKAGYVVCVITSAIKNAYADVIRSVASFYGIPCVDCTKMLVGKGYTSHPNSQGMAMMCECVINQLLDFRTNENDSIIGVNLYPTPEVNGYTLKLALLDGRICNYLRRNSNSLTACTPSVDFSITDNLASVTLASGDCLYLDTYNNVLRRGTDVSPSPYNEIVAYAYRGKIQWGKLVESTIQFQIDSLKGHDNEIDGKIKDIKELINESVFSDIIVERGGLSTSDGTEQDGATALQRRVRTDTYLSAPFILEINSGSRIGALLKYNKDTRAYIGYDSYPSVAPFTTKINIDDESYIYRVLFTKEDSTQEFTDEEVIGLLKDFKGKVDYSIDSLKADSDNCYPNFCFYKGAYFERNGSQIKIHCPLQNVSPYTNIFGVIKDVRKASSVSWIYCTLPSELPSGVVISGSEAVITLTSTQSIFLDNDNQLAIGNQNTSNYRCILFNYNGTPHFGLGVDSIQSHQIIKNIDDIKTLQDKVFVETYPYTGSKIDLSNRWNIVLRQILGTAKAIQSMAHYGDRMFMLCNSNSLVQLYIYDLNTGALIQEIANVNTGSLTNVHCNVSFFGKEFYTGNNKYPLLYTSQWNGNRALLAYNIVENEGRDTYTVTLVQTITPDSSALVDEIGSGWMDYIYDPLTDKLVSISYHISGEGYYDTEHDAHVAIFDMPLISDGGSVTLDTAVDSYRIPQVNVRQDMTINNSKIYLFSGMPNSGWPAYLTVINLISKNISNKILISDIYSDFFGEPEGVDIIDGNLVVTSTSNKGKLYQMNFF